MRLIKTRKIVTYNPNSQMGVVNPIFKIHWLGWESDSLTLQRHGWQIMMEEQRAAYTFGTILRIAIAHPKHNVYGLTQEYAYNVVEMSDFDLVRQRESMHLDICLNVIDLCKDFIFTSTSKDELEGFVPYDAEPRYEVKDLHMHKLSDLFPFKPASEVQQLIVDPNSVPELLCRIKDLQAPKQKELREKYRKQKRRERRLQAQVHAEILSVKEIAA